MKKSGFTLSELLITVAIIGVVSAIASPIINNLLPDKNKVAVLKIHKVVSDINEQLLDNITYYYSHDDSCEGLACTQAAADGTVDTDGKAAEGADKYSILLQKHLQVKSGATNTSFITIDGNVWTFDTSTYNFAASDSANQYAIFTVDVDPSKSWNVYSSDNPKKNDTFRFKVNPNGSVEGCDELTQAYLKNPHKLNDRKADYSVAATLSSCIAETTSNNSGQNGEGDDSGDNNDLGNDNDLVPDRGTPVGVGDGVIKEVEIDLGDKTPAAGGGYSGSTNLILPEEQPEGKPLDYDSSDSLED